MTPLSLLRYGGMAAELGRWASILGGNERESWIMSQALKGKVALVAGATRGAGRGIAVQLGAAGATVYCHRANHAIRSDRK